MQRHRLALFLLTLAAILPTQGMLHSEAPVRAQTGTGGSPADSVYHLDAGRTSLRQVRGERILVLSRGVTITHGDVVVKSDSGYQYTAQKLTVLVGNVNIDQEDLHLEGDRGTYRRFQDHATLVDNVKIIDGAWTIRGDKAEFYRSQGHAWLFGNVVAVDSATTVRADSVFHDRDNQLTEAFGNVSIESEGEGVRVEGRHGYFFRDEGIGIVDKDPHLIVDPTSREPAFVDADTMLFHPEENRAIAVGRVKIIKGNTITQCDSAVLVDREERVELYGSPRAKQGDISMAGDRMILYYNDEEVEKISLAGAAEIREVPADSLIVGRDSWIHGDSIVMYIRRNELDSIRVTGSAVSEYYPRSPNRIEANYARGGEMFFAFENDSLEYVNIVGEADGTYRYIDLEPKQTVDSLRAVADTSFIYIPFEENAKRVVYSADSIEYYAKVRDLVLVNKSKVEHEGRTLLAHHIVYNADLEFLDARGSPILIEGSDKFYGNKMAYDLEEEVGLVREGSTHFIQGYYDGEDVAMVGVDKLKLWHSTYTTCELKTPHYHFASNQMKVYLDDKVVSGPIVLYVGKTPIAALPFFADNIKQGRSSGILRPDFEFGITSTGDRFIRDIGYYWATNDYTDFTFVGDFNEDRALLFRVDNRYRLRYLLDGGVNFRFFKSLDTEDNVQNEWEVRTRHNQVLGEKFTFDANLRFVSSDEAPSSVSRIDEVADIIDRRIESTLNLRKTWNTVGFSAAFRRTQTLDVRQIGADRIDATLPNVSFSIPSISLWPGKETKIGRKSLWESILGGILVSPRASFNRRDVERLIAEEQIDTLGTKRQFFEDVETISSRQSLSFTSRPGVGMIALSPNISFTNDYMRTHTRADEVFRVDSTGVDTVLSPGGTTIVEDNVFTWNAGVSASTNLYGTFYPNIGRWNGIRHAVSPTASYSYTPSVGGRPSNQSVGLSLRNTIDLKVLDDPDDAESARRISGVFIWSLRSAYNPKAPSKQGWGNVSSSMNLRVLGRDFSFNQTIDPYQWDVVQTSFTSTFRFEGTHGFGVSRQTETQELNVVAADTTGAETDRNRPLGRGGGGPPTDTTGLPWNLNASLSYTKFGDNPPSSTLNVNGGINLTRKWRIQYNAQYDVEARDLRGQNFRITRDLHCWEMSFARQQLGDEWEFYFRINIKAHPELYAEQGRRGLAGGGFSSGFQY